jgi:hypothetical protein
MKDSSRVPREVIAMLLMKERRPLFRTIDGWVRCVLLEAGAIRECEEHGWMKDRSDPHARERALVAARRDPPPNVPAEEAVAAVRNVLDTIGDTCPECPPEE